MRILIFFLIPAVIIHAQGNVNRKWFVSGQTDFYMRNQKTEFYSARISAGCDVRLSRYDVYDSSPLYLSLAANASLPISNEKRVYNGAGISIGTKYYLANHNYKTRWFGAAGLEIDFYHIGRRREQFEWSYLKQMYALYGTMGYAFYDNLEITASYTHALKNYQTFDLPRERLTLAVNIFLGRNFWFSPIHRK